MTITGINYVTNSNGQITSTLHVIEEFNDYYRNSEDGRDCIGKKHSQSMLEHMMLVLLSQGWRLM